MSKELVQGADDAGSVWLCSPKPWRLLGQPWKPRGSSRPLNHTPGTSSTQATGDFCRLMSRNLEKSPQVEGPLRDTKAARRKSILPKLLSQAFS